MRQLLTRFIQLWSAEGLKPAIVRGIRYAIRASVHQLGKRWLYGSKTYRRFSIYCNQRYGRYTAVPDPVAIYWINPARITRITGRGPNPGRFQWQQLGLIQGGGWDQMEDRFEELPIYRGMVERYREGVPWHETTFFEHMQSRLSAGTADWKGVSSQVHVLERCERLDNLFESIREDGYLSMSALIDRGTVDAADHRLPEDLARIDEVAVDIGRDGEYLFVDGRHRLAIAKILGLDEIPVRIAARHANWQQIREQVAAADNPTELPEHVSQHLGHPDLQDFVYDSN